jgi:asparagine synthetase B (glutamine-hydrolysing)
VNLDVLRQDVAHRQPDIRSMPVAEVLAWTYKLGGIDFVTRLRGAFAIAVWDKDEGRLILAIDPLGIKSLYWSRQGTTLGFAPQRRCGSRLARVPRDRPRFRGPVLFVQRGASARVDLSQHPGTVASPAPGAPAGPTARKGDFT